MKHINYTNPYPNRLNEEDDDNEMPKGENPLGMLLDSKFEKQFLEQRRVFLWGAVEDSTAKAVVNRLLYLDAKEPGKPITFYINSPGGVVTSGMVIYDAIKLISSPVHTVCMGLAASMGSILLSAGAKGHRSIFPHGEVMIHQPSLGGMMRGKSTDLEIQAEQIKKTKLIGAQILATNCGKPLETILKDFERDYWMDAKEAVAYGIVDSIADKLI